jgi:hypothetical protein
MFEDLLNNIQLYSKQFINIIDILGYGEFSSFNLAFDKFKTECSNSNSNSDTYSYIETIYNTFHVIEDKLLHIRSYKGKSKTLNFDFLNNIVLYDIDFQKILEKESKSDKKNLCLYLYNLYYPSSLYRLKKTDDIVKFLENLKNADIKNKSVVKSTIPRTNITSSKSTNPLSGIDMTQLDSLFKNKKVGNLFKGVIDNIMTSGLNESLGDLSNITDITQLQQSLMSSDIVDNVKKNVEENFKQNDLNEDDLKDELSHLMNKFGLNGMNLESLASNPSALLSQLGSMKFPGN